MVEGNVNLGTSQSGDDTPSGMVTLAKLAAEWWQAVVDGSKSGALEIESSDTYLKSEELEIWKEKKLNIIECVLQYKH